jgi:hypothetical protein
MTALFLVAAQSFLQPARWLTCSHCISLVRANVYNEQFAYHLFLICLPLIVLAVLVAIIHRL